MARSVKKRIVQSSEDEETAPNGTVTTKKAATPRKRKAPLATYSAPQQPSSQSDQVTAKRQKGTIHSFFNATTELQKLNQAGSTDNSPHKTIDDDGLEEDIIDISDDDDRLDAAAIKFTNGSSTQAAHRKRKLKFNDPSYEDKSFDSSSGTKFKKGSVSEHTRFNLETTRPWTEQYPPADLTELAVHKKKVGQVRSVLEESLSHRARPRLIVLKGPAGTGKTTTVKLLARSMGFTIREWENPTGTAEGVSAVSASARFEEFFLRGANFATLDFDDEQHRRVSHDAASPDDAAQIVLVEEFPSTLAISSGILQSFRSTVQQYLSIRAAQERPCTPVIMIVSETLLSSTASAAENFTAHRLLGPAILTHPLTALVEFNNVAPTILIKALETVVVKEARKSDRRRTPGPGVLKVLAETGDIRSALSSLEFLCLRGDANEDTWSAKVAFTKPKRAVKDAPLTKKEQESLALIGNRGTTLGIFHAVGKVVYNKRLDPAGDQDAEMWQHHRPPETDPEDLLIELGTDISIFVAALHENFTLSCASQSRETTLDSLNACLDALSDADLMQCGRFNSVGGRGFQASALDSQRQHDMSFQTAVRGLQSSLPFPVKRGEMPGEVQSGRNGAFKMFYPSSIKIWSKSQAMSDELDLVIAQGSLGSPAVVGKGEGVESWKRNSASVATCASIVQPHAARMETLLERLPLAAHIFSTRKEVDSRLVARIRQLTSFDGLGVRPDEEEVDEEDLMALDGLDEPGGNQKDVRRSNGDMRVKVGSNSRRLDTEGAGLRIPVEHDVEKLVLSDDDIVDDFD